MVRDDYIYYFDSDYVEIIEAYLALLDTLCNFLIHGYDLPRIFWIGG